MKNSKLFMLIALMGIQFSSNAIFAQSSYVSFNVGYGLPMNAQDLGVLGFSNNVTEDQTVSYKEAKGSLGKGTQFGAAFGHMFTPFIGAELGISYLLGGKSEATEQFNANYKANYSVSSNMIRFIPAIIFSGGLGKINPYARLGLVVGSASIKYSDFGRGYDQDFTNKQKLSGGLSLGFNGSVGADFKLSDNLSLFGELNVISQSYAPKKAVITEAIRDGFDELSNYSVSEKETEFVDSYTSQVQNPQPDSEPSKELKKYFSYGSVGINVGLRISL